VAVTFMSDGAGGTGITPFASQLATVFDGPRSGTVTVDTAVKEHGYAALKHDSAASASAYVARLACLADAGRRISVRVRFDNTHAIAAGGAFIRVLSAAAGTLAEVRINTAQRLELRAGSSGTTLLATGATVLSANGTTWYRVALCYTITSAAVSEWRLYLNGTLEATGSNPATQGTGSSGLRVGWTGTSPGANIVMRSQDWYVDDSSALTDPGDIRVTSKMPAGWDRVAERPANTANRYTHAATTAVVREQYTVQAAAVGDDDLTGASVVAWAGWVHYAVVAAIGSTLAKIIVNGVDITPTTTTGGSGVYQTLMSVVNSTTYPSGSNAVGLASTGTAVDTLLAECGVFIAYTTGGAATAAPPPWMTYRKRRQQTMLAR
jgi:hypothetical protein